MCSSSLHLGPAALWILLSALLVTPVAAGPAASYGKNFVRLGQSWQDELPPRPLLAPIADADADADVDEDADEDGAGYLQRLEQLELTQGPYADSLAEPLMDLGRLHLDAGQFEQAGQLYRRALHVVRINDGLQSERQLPLVQNLLKVYRGLGDWQGLDQRYEYYQRIAGVPQDHGIAVTLEYFRWQREALRRQLDSNAHRRLLRLYEQNAQLLEGVGTGAEDGLSVADRWQLVASQLRNLYLIQVLVQPRLDTRDIMTASPYYQQQRQQQELDIHEQRLLNIQRTAVSEGAALLQDFIAGTGPGNEVLQARAWLEMADWHQWNGSRHQASEDYAGLAGHLLDTGQSALLQEWFAEPVELPDNGVFLRDPGTGGISLSAQYDVSADGRARNLETKAEDEEHKGFAMRLYRSLLATRFRPRFDHGEAVTATGLQRDYRYLDREAVRRFQSP